MLAVEQVLRSDQVLAFKAAFFNETGSLSTMKDYKFTGLSENNRPKQICIWIGLGQPFLRKKKNNFISASIIKFSK